MPALIFSLALAFVLVIYMLLPHEQIVELLTTRPSLERAVALGFAGLMFFWSSISWSRINRRIDVIGTTSTTTENVTVGRLMTLLGTLEGKVRQDEALGERVRAASRGLGELSARIQALANSDSGIDAMADKLEKAIAEVEELYQKITTETSEVEELARRLDELKDGIEAAEALIADLAETRATLSTMGARLVKISQEPAGS